MSKALGWVMASLSVRMVLSGGTGSKITAVLPVVANRLDAAGDHPGAEASSCRPGDGRCRIFCYSPPPPPSLSPPLSPPPSLPPSAPPSLSLSLSRTLQTIIRARQPVVASPVTAVVGSVAPPPPLSLPLFSSPPLSLSPLPLSFSLFPPSLSLSSGTQISYLVSCQMEAQSKG